MIALGGTADSRGQEAVALPKVSVAARVPLVKVAEHHLVQKRFAAAAVADGRYLYFIGGQDAAGDLLDTIERFDPETGKSEPFARLQTARLWHRAVVHNGRLVVLGGATSLLSKNEMKRRQSRTPSPLILCDKVESVDLATRNVETLRPMPYPRKEFGCVILDGKIYVLGGRYFYKEKSVPTNTVDIFDPVAGKWASGVPMPKPVMGDAVIIAGPAIIVPGGYDGLDASEKVYGFNPAQNKWGPMPALCKPSSAHSAVVFGHHLFLFGNYSDPRELIAYNLGNRTSEAFTLQYTPARHAAAIAFNGCVYVAGGKERSDSTPLDTIQVFAPPSRKTGT